MFIFDRLVFQPVTSDVSQHPLYPAVVHDFFTPKVKWLLHAHEL